MAKSRWLPIQFAQPCAFSDTYVVQRNSNQALSAASNFGIDANGVYHGFLIDSSCNKNAQLMGEGSNCGLCWLQEMDLLLGANAPHATLRRSTHSGLTVAREKSR